MSRGAVLAGSTLPGPLVEDAIGRLFGVHAMLPSQMPRRRSAGAAQRLAVALLVEAFRTAGLVAGRNYRVSAATRRAARAWLVGQLDADVAVSVAWCCAALGLDPAALAAAIRRQCA